MEGYNSDTNFVTVARKVEPRNLYVVVLINSTTVSRKWLLEYPTCTLEMVVSHCLVQWMVEHLYIHSWRGHQALCCVMTDYLYIHALLRDGRLPLHCFSIVFLASELKVKQNKTNSMMTLCERGCFDSKVYLSKSHTKINDDTTSQINRKMFFSKPQFYSQLHERLVTGAWILDRAKCITV